METADDDVTAGSKQWMSHQERQTLVKNRAYATTESTESSQRSPESHALLAVGVNQSDDPSMK
jgi:hypothetical protein